MLDSSCKQRFRNFHLVQGQHDLDPRHQIINRNFKKGRLRKFVNCHYLEKDSETETGRVRVEAMIRLCSSFLRICVKQ